MTTPVLTKKQQRHSLSAKKGPAKGLRNILAQPNLNFLVLSHMMPVIKVNQYPELTANLNMILPSIKQTNNKIPKHMLKNVPKEERVLARREMLKTAPPKPDILKFMIMGINAVTRALEKDNVCCVLLDANVEPLMIKHIVIMAVNKKIPVLLLPILKTITLEKMGFATAVFALKQEVKQCPDNVCHPLYKSIAEIFENFETPECLFQRFESEKVSDKSAICEAKTDMDCDTNPNISKPEKPVTVFTDVYKYRSSRDKRAFIPPTVDKSSQVSQTSDDFIAVDSDLDPVNDKSSTATVEDKRYVNISKKGKRTKKPENIEKDQSFKKLKLIENNADFIALDSNLDSVNDKNFTIKNKRYADIDKEEKDTKESENTEKNQSFNKLKLIDNNTDSIKQTKSYTLKRHANDEPNYLSLKLKRIQGNAKRKKSN